MVSQAGTRNAQLIYRSASLNNTRASVSTYRGDLGDYVVARTDISFTAPDTIGCAGGAFPEFFSNAQVNGTFTNLVTNSDFASGTGWTTGSGWSIGAGVATASTASSALSSAITVTAGRTYTLTFTMTRSAGSVVASVGGTAGTSRSSSSTFTETFVAGSSGVIAFTGT